MAEQKSKRDLIWEEKRRQREERLLRMEGQVQEYQPPPRLEEQFPISYPTQQEYQQPYIPPEFNQQQQQQTSVYNPVEPINQIQQQTKLDTRSNRSNSYLQQQKQQVDIINQSQETPQKLQYKQQQDDYRDYLQKQINEKEQEKKRNRNMTDNQRQQSQQQVAAYDPKSQQKEYGEFLRQQMQQKEDDKKRRIQSGRDQQQQQQQQLNQYSQQQYSQQQIIQPQQIDQNKQQKQLYGEFLRMQMYQKENEKNDKKQNLQQKMEQGDYFPFGKQQQPQKIQYQEQPQQYIQQQQYQQPQIYQQLQQMYQPPDYQYQQQQQNYQQPNQQYQQLNQQYQQPNQQYQQQQQLIQYEMPQQPILNDPQPELKAGRNRLQMENANVEELRKKEQQKQEMQRVLQQQIEEKKRKKEQERLQKEMEDKMEEERFRREKEQQELERKREEEQKKQQQGKFAQENIDLKEQRRLERIQERKNRRNQQEDQQQQEQQSPMMAPQQQYNPPPSQPKSDNYLRDFLMDQKAKEGVSPHQSIVDFYRNGPRQQDVQQNREIDDLKRQMLQQQDNLQQQIQQVMNQAQQAIDGRNKAEQELNSLKEQVKNKYLQEERHHDDLMVALVKSDPKWENQVFPPHLLAQAQMSEYKDLSMPPLKENFNLPNSQNQQIFQPAYQSKPLVMKEESREQKQQFREQFGLQSLVSDSNMVPIDHNASLVPQIQKVLNKKGSEIQLDKIDELNAHFEDSLKLEVAEQYNIPIQREDQHQQWNIPSIDSNFVKEIDDLLKYNPAQHSIQFKRPPSNNQRPPSQVMERQLTNQRPQSTFGRAANGILGSTNNPITLDSNFPDLTMIKKNTDTFDIAGINKRMDQKLLQLNDLEEDPDMQKLDKLLYQYNK